MDWLRTATLLLCLSLTQCQSTGDPDKNYTECGSLKLVLLKALFNTERNLYELDRVFAPPRIPSLRYVEVEYSFANRDGRYGDCKVEYKWAVGGFLLVQPPRIFQFTSLLFWYAPLPDADGDKRVTLKLPHACRVLVNDTNGNCSCHESEGAKDLQILTRQIDQYSKYLNPVNVVQDFTSSAQAVCSDSLKETEYFGGDVQLYFILVLVMPVMIMAILVLVIRSIHSPIHTKLTKSYRNLAGLTLASIHVLMFILVMDCYAVHYYNTEMHELSQNSVQGHINLFSTAITISLDLLVTLQFLFFMTYLSCALYGDGYKYTKRIIESGLLCLIMPYFYAMFGNT